MNTKTKKVEEKLDNFILSQKLKLEREHNRLLIQSGKIIMVGSAVKIIFQLCKERDLKVRHIKRKELNLILFGLDATTYINSKYN